MSEALGDEGDLGNAEHPNETPRGRDKQEHHSVPGSPPPAQGNRSPFSLTPLTSACPEMQ